MERREMGWRAANDGGDGDGGHGGRTARRTAGWEERRRQQTTWVRRMGQHGGWRAVVDHGELGPEMVSVARLVWAATGGHGGIDNSELEVAAGDRAPTEMGPWGGGGDESAWVRKKGGGPVTVEDGMAMVDSGGSVGRGMDGGRWLDGFWVHGGWQPTCSAEVTGGGVSTEEGGSSGGGLERAATCCVLEGGGSELRWWSAMVKGEDESNEGRCFGGRQGQWCMGGGSGWQLAGHGREERKEQRWAWARWLRRTQWLTMAAGKLLAMASQAACQVVRRRRWSVGSGHGK